MSSARWRRLENRVTWSTLLVYYAIWVWMPMTMEVPAYDWVGWVIGGAYVAGHAYELKYRGHCYLSADATAFPWAIQAGMLLFLTLHFGFDASWSDIGKLATAFVISFGAGHLAAMVYGAVMTGVMAMLFPDKEEEGKEPSSGPPPSES